MLCCYFIRPISEDEIKHLREHRYAAISDKQVLIDQKLQKEVRPALKERAPVFFIFISLD